ncbi:MAG: crossover junction endodeoxyribonuclease RuvC [Gemmatimonadota bacterium]|nr:crossover junction endodeoxyribonuclease RuvC [Gemmatimonadota bacterium]
MPRRVLGIDPGTRATGYGLVVRDGARHRLVECGVIRPPAAADLTTRLVEIHSGLVDLLDRLGPECVAIEGVFAGRNARTAMVLGHARGVLVLAAAQRGLPVHEYPPREVKKRVVGTGDATKTQVGFMVRQHLKLAEAPSPADAADGCAIALCHLLGGSIGSGRAIAVPT